MSVFEAHRDAAFSKEGGHPSPSPLLLPPRGFTPVSAPSRVEMTSNPYIRRNSRSSSAQKAGLAYEKKAKEWLKLRDPEGLILGQWFKFFDGKVRYCQPDALIFSKEGLTIVEMKIRFSDLAWWQLTRLYLPVMRKYFGTAVANIRLICMTKSYDPAVVVPTRPVLIDDFNTGWVEPGYLHEVHVFLWRP